MGAFLRIALFAVAGPPIGLVVFMLYVGFATLLTRGTTSDFVPMALLDPANTQLAYLYGGRPGTLGMIRLLRHVIAHLAITGGMAASDSLVQQMLGHGIAAKLSQRLGEGVLNGLLTARLGLAAIEVTRPLPFAALPPPKLSDLATDLLRKKEDEE